jgi:hypothetical protein
LTNLGRLVIFIPACFALILLWMFLLAVSATLFVVGDRITPMLNKLDRWLVKDIE